LLIIRIARVIFIFSTTFWLEGVLGLEISEHSFHQSVLLDAETGVETSGGEFQKNEISFTHTGELDISEYYRINSIIRFRSDFADQLEYGEPQQYTRDKYSKRVLFGSDSELELRELYFDSIIDDHFLRIGKQQVVWGQADGFKVLDVVNPQTFREFILEDYDKSRIPLWMMAFEAPISNGLIQLLWIPDNTYHEYVESESTYAFTSHRYIPLPQNGKNTRYAELNPPGRFFSDSELGLRYSAFLDGWDLTINYLYHYYDQPVYVRESGAESDIYKPEYIRTHTLGGTATNAWGNLTFRSEIAYFKDRKFNTNDVLDLDAVKEYDEFRYVIGLDWHGFADTLVSGQLYQSILTDHSDHLSRKQVDTNISLLIKKDYFQQTLRTKLFWIHGYHDHDGLFQVSIDYDLLSDVILRLGMDFFYGRKSGVFGQFDRADRVTMGFEWAL
jgi:hypothetical protein